MWVTRLRQWYCGLRFGHAYLDVFETQKWSLTCTNCGHQTPGWALRQPPPVMRPKVVRFRKRLRRIA